MGNPWELCPPYPQPQDVPPTILQHSYTKGTPTPTPNHRKFHPPSYNTHTLKGPPAPTYPQPKEIPPTILEHSYTKGTPHPPTPNHRMYHPPSYNTHTLKGPPTLLPPTTEGTTHHLATLIH